MVFYIIVQQLKAAHRDKLLGNIWALLDPVCMTFVFYLVFHYVRQAQPSFNLYFLSGLLAWQMFAVPVKGMTLCLKKRKDLILKFPLPLGIFPVAITLQRIYDIFWGLLTYAGFYIFLKMYDPTMEISYVRLLLMPVWIVAFTMFTMGVGFIVARIGVFFADMEDIVSVLLQMGYFITPVFIDMHYFPSTIHKIYFLVNPIAGFITYFRMLLPGYNVIVPYQIPVPHYPTYLALVSVLTLCGGFAIFHYGSRDYTKYL